MHQPVDFARDVTETCDFGWDQVITESQKHFYMETQTALAMPDEDNCMVVYVSTQTPDYVQRAVAAALGIPFHNVRIITRRVGGGFDGKVFHGTAVRSNTTHLCVRSSSQNC